MNVLNTRDLNARTLLSLVPLCVLNEACVVELVASAHGAVLDPGERIMGTELEADTSVYLLEGRLDVFNQDESTLHIEAGSDSSRFALPGLNAQHGVAVAASTASVLYLDNAKLCATIVACATAQCTHLFESAEDRHRERLIARVMTLDLFANVAPANIPRIFTLLERKFYEPRDVVAVEGNISDHYYLVGSGRFEVSRAAPSGARMVLGCLHEGQSFGEESLVPNACYQATTTALVSSTLLALDRDGLLELMQIPQIDSVDCTRAEDLVRAGARWLDVRSEPEFTANGLQGAIHVPFFAIAKGDCELEEGFTYVVYCDNGLRSAAAAQHLLESGYATCVLSGGLLQSAPQSPTLMPAIVESPNGAERAVVPAKSTLAERTEIVEQLVSATEEVDSALARKARLEVARAIENERDIDSDDDVQSHRLACKEKASLEHKSKRASEALAKALEEKNRLEALLRKSDAEASEERERAKQHVQQLRVEAQKSLREEQIKLEQEYAMSTQRLLELKKERATAEAVFREEHLRLQERSTAAAEALAAEEARLEQRLAQAKQVAKRRADDIRAQEDEHERALRERTERVLLDKRKRLETEFSKCVSAQQEAQREVNKLRDEHAQAQLEAQRLAERVEASRVARKKRERERLLQEQAKLTAKAQQAQARLDAAAAERDAAANAQMTIERRLSILDDDTTTPAKSDDTVEVRALGAAQERVLRANEDVADARREVQAAKEAHDSAANIADAQRQLEDKLRTELDIELERARSHVEPEYQGPKTARAEDCMAGDKIIADVEAQLTQKVQHAPPLRLLSPAARIEAALNQHRRRQELRRNRNKVKAGGADLTDAGQIQRSSVKE